jgi:hypothetical protein
MTISGISPVAVQSPNVAGKSAQAVPTGQGSKAVAATKPVVAAPIRSRDADGDNDGSGRINIKA